MRANFLDEVDLGRLGKNIGLPNCFKRFNDYLYGIQKKTYYAIGGLPGTGKSGFVDDNFILSPYFTLVDVKLPTAHIHWIYYSFEVDYISKRAKWTAYRLFQKHKLLCDSNYILSRGKNKISQDIYDKVVDVTQELDVLFDHMTFVEDATNPTGIFREVIGFAEKRGKFDYEPYDSGDGHISQRIVAYKANNPDEVVMVLADHVALAKKERNYGTKDNIDKLSEYFIFFRNRLRYIPIAVVQFNKGLTSIDRIKFKKELLLPTLEDFKDTGNIGQDCNVALGLFNPFNMDFTDHLGYPIMSSSQRQGFEDLFRSVNIMKNRDGEAWRHIGMFYLGGLGMFRELPKIELFESGLASVSNYLSIKPIKTEQNDTSSK